MLSHVLMSTLAALFSSNGSVVRVASMVILDSHIITLSFSYFVLRLKEYALQAKYHSQQ